MSRVARSRNLKPGFFTNYELAQCDYGARLLFAGLWTIADRQGRLEDHPARIKGLLFPFNQKAKVPDWLDELADYRFIFRYESGGAKFIQILNFSKHQTPHQKEPESLIPAPDLSDTSLGLVRHATYIDRGKQVSGIKEEGNRKQETGSANRFEPPSVEDVRTYCESRKNQINAEQFVDFYASKGWKVGNQAMKDWQAAVRTWERNQRSNGLSSDDPRGNLATLRAYMERQHGDDEPIE